MRDVKAEDLEGGGKGIQSFQYDYEGRDEKELR